MTASTNSRRWTTRRTLCAAVPVIIVIVALLLLRGCETKPEPEPKLSAQESLFVPRDLARLKQLDRDGVLEYCRTQIKPASYEGILRGAHGALNASFHSDQPRSKARCKRMAGEIDSTWRVVVMVKPPMMVWYPSTEAYPTPAHPFHSFEPIDWKTNLIDEARADMTACGL